MPAVSVRGIVTPRDSADDRCAVTVTGEPSVTGFGTADKVTEGRSLSRMSRRRLELLNSGFLLSAKR